MEHTNGTWEVKGFRTFSVWRKGTPIATCRKNKANAKLIAAAPDLLEASKALLAFQDTDSIFRLPANSEEVKNLRRAVDKAQS
jgi:hypothetical protein